MAPECQQPLSGDEPARSPSTAHSKGCGSAPEMYRVTSLGHIGLLGLTTEAEAAALQAGLQAHAAQVHYLFITPL